MSSSSLYMCDHDGMDGDGAHIHMYIPCTYMYTTEIYTETHKTHIYIYTPLKRHLKVPVYRKVRVKMLYTI